MLIKAVSKMLIFGAFSLLANAVAIAGSEPIRLKPSSKWAVDYQPDGCRLIRQFGEGENPVILWMSSFSPSGYFNITLIGERFKINDQRTISIQFGPNEAEQKSDFLPGNVAKIPSLLSKDALRIAPFTPEQLEDIKKVRRPHFVQIEPLGKDRLNAVNFLGVGKLPRNDIVLELGGMDKPLAALRTCVGELFKSWGLDYEKHQTMIRPAMPINKISDWVHPEDYPMNMLYAGQWAIVQFRLDIDESGAVTGCYIQETTRLKEFDDAVCKSVMRRGKFEPALDAGGLPMKSFFHGTVHFEI